MRYSLKKRRAWGMYFDPAFVSSCSYFVPTLKIIPFGSPTSMVRSWKSLEIGELSIKYCETKYGSKNWTALLFKRRYAPRRMSLSKVFLNSFMKWTTGTTGAVAYWISLSWCDASHMIAVIFRITERSCWAFKEGGTAFRTRSTLTEYFFSWETIEACFMMRES